MSEKKLLPEEYLVIVERISLRHNLERVLIPATVACWLARRWPEWALPAALWVRLNEFFWSTMENDEGANEA